ncbi:MAG: alpha/beta hydrolase [Clostridiales Family XIII bacterium]|jgi:pimeloyl-ACP methyl ester carboxylesterase|nr:alpha/beta hydrolase [Clostridiales Family XIII bacterium]
MAMELVRIPRQGGSDIVGTLHTPDNYNGMPPILIVHGYLASNRIGYYHLYFDIAKHFESLGFYCLRIDMSGFGESGVDIETITLHTHLQDIQDARSFLLSRDQIETDKINLVAHCVGCTSSAVFAKSNPELIHRLVLINPFFLSPFDIKNLLTENQEDEEYAELKAQGYVYRKGFYMHGSFFEDDKALVNLEKDILGMTSLVIADDDKYIDQGILSTLQCKKIIIEKANHDFIEKQSRMLMLKTLESLLGDSNE